MTALDEKPMSPARTRPHSLRKTWSRMAYRSTRGRISIAPPMLAYALTIFLGAFLLFQIQFDVEFTASQPREAALDHVNRTKHPLREEHRHKRRDDERNNDGAQRRANRFLDV